MCVSEVTWAKSLPGMKQDLLKPKMVLKGKRHRQLYWYSSSLTLPTPFFGWICSSCLFCVFWVTKAWCYSWLPPESSSSLGILYPYEYSRQISPYRYPLLSPVSSTSWHILDVIKPNMQQTKPTLFLKPSPHPILMNGTSIHSSKQNRRSIIRQTAAPLLFFISFTYPTIRVCQLLKTFPNSPYLFMSILHCLLDLGKPWAYPLTCGMASCHLCLSLWSVSILRSEWPYQNEKQTM